MNRLPQSWLAIQIFIISTSSWYENIFSQTKKITQEDDFINKTMNSYFKTLILCRFKYILLYLKNRFIHFVLQTLHKRLDNHSHLHSLNWIQFEMDFERSRNYRCSNCIFIDFTENDLLDKTLCPLCGSPVHFVPPVSSIT